MIGTCSLCGGCVASPSAWGGIVPPVPTCQRCGATPKNQHEKVVEMEQFKKTSLGVFDRTMLAINSRCFSDCQP